MTREFRAGYEGIYSLLGNTTMVIAPSSLLWRSKLFQPKFEGLWQTSAEQTHLPWAELSPHFLNPTLTKERCHQPHLLLKAPPLLL